MDRLDRLQAVEDIKTLKARYFRLMDTKRWDAFAKLFTPDMTVIAPDGSIWLSGGAAFADSIRHSLTDAVSVHQGFSPEIEIIDAENAKGIWPMQDIIIWKDRHPREGWKSILGRGHYHETYRKSDEHWQIATLSLSRLRLDVT